MNKRLTSALRRAALLFGAALALSAGSFDAAAASPEIGDTPPSAVGQTRDGDPVLLTSYPGKAVVLSFWATWCPYCQKELPILEGIQRVAKGRMQVIAVNTESREVFRSAARSLGNLTLLLAHDVGGTASRAYGVKGIPHMVIVGRDGRVLQVYRGYDESLLPEIVDDINRAIAAPPPPQPPASAPQR